MLARDNNSSPTQYRTWVVPGTPDFTGSQYLGFKSGDSSFDDVTTHLVTDDSAVVDFNLPNPTSWIITERVLPYNIYDSQLAIIDGYVYLFGGGGSNKIFRATLDNPADWTDTGSTLPSIISNSQLAIVDGYVYLFGGNNHSTDGYGAINNIYRAPTTNPLSWVDTGATLPKKIQDSQLTIVDGYIYLLGGRTDGYGATNNIFQAFTSDPLTWTTSPNTLYKPLYGSHVSIIGETIYLFGGFTAAKTPTNNIFSAHLADLSNWVIAGSLPFPTFNGQFVVIGTRGYLIAPTSTTVSFTKILRCNLSTPNIWVDSTHTVPGELKGSQLAIIDDRLFLFGGNANTVIYADDSILEYDFTSANVVAYGDRTRTQVNATPDKLDLFPVLGFPYWKTTYV